MKMMRRLAHIAHALDQKGLHAEADGLTQVMARLHTRFVRVAQQGVSVPAAGDKTLEALVGQLPGGEMFGKNLSTSLYGAQHGFNQIPGGTYEGKGPENPLMGFGTPYDFKAMQDAGLSPEDMLSVSEAHANYLASQQAPRIRPYIQQMADFVKRNPTMSVADQEKYASELIQMASGLDMGTGVLWTVLKTEWPTMPPAIKARIEREMKLEQDVKNAGAFFTGSGPIGAL